MIFIQPKQERSLSPQEEVLNYNNDLSPLGINLQGVIDWSPELVFINYAKRAREWISQEEGMPWGEGPALNLDENGYIISLEAGQSADLFIGTSPYYELGTYYVFFQGEGRLNTPSGEITVSGSTFSQNQMNDYLVVSLLETNPDDYIRNLAIVHEDQLSAYHNGDPFYQSFLGTWSCFNYIRFMDWGKTNNSTITDWNSRPKPGDYSYGLKGVPVEEMVNLANALDANPWFTFPHQADDDYIRQFARYVRDNLDPDLDIYLEYSNEVWNGIFDQHAYAVQQGRNLGYNDFEGTEDDFYGMIIYYAERTSEICQIWEEEFADTERLIGVFAAGGPSSWIISQGMDYLQSHNRDSYIDVAATAPYVGSGESYSSVDAALAILNSELDSFETRVADVHAAAQAEGLRLIAYEGGQHLWEFGEGFTDIGEDAQADTRMYGWVLDYMEGWRENGGNEFMVFSSGGGFWGQIPWGVDKMEAPKYRGHYDFIMNNPVWWEE